MADKIKLGDNEYYEPSDSEDELSEEERELIDKLRQKRDVDDRNREVLRFDETDSDAEEDNDEDDVENGLADSDIDEGRQFDGIPDEKAWGKKRSAYYHTDFVDQDYSTYNEKEEELAQQEEEEAKAIQQRLAKQLDEADFTLDVYTDAAAVEPSSDSELSKTKLKSDFTQLSARQKQQLFEKDSPEFAGLVQDFEKYSRESEMLLSPILSYVQANDVELPAFSFVRTRNNLILTYCTNIGFYLVLKSKRIPVKNHPIVKRLVQLRQLLIQLDASQQQQVVMPQLEELLEAVKNGEEINITPVTGDKPTKLDRKKRLNILKVTGGKRKDVAADGDDDDSDADELMETSDDDDEKKQQDDEEEKQDGEIVDRRGITYQIAKNKGLTPSRKKENRNPRVKHRNKYRKALIRRKGAVRTVRKELSRYGGEMTGIKSNVKKGIRFKS